MATSSVGHSLEHPGHPALPPFVSRVSGPAHPDYTGVRPFRAMHRTSMDHHTRILVVDDDPDLRKLIGDFLAGHGYRVSVAENAAAMRASIEREHPDLVILDV